MKKKITLTESQLISLIKKTVNKIISEQTTDDSQQVSDDVAQFLTSLGFKDKGYGSYELGISKGLSSNRPSIKVNILDAVSASSTGKFAFGIQVQSNLYQKKNDVFKKIEQIVGGVFKPYSKTLGEDNLVGIGGSVDKSRLQEIVTILKA